MSNLVAIRAVDNIPVNNFDGASARAFALAYGKAGLRTIPIPYGSKKPTMLGWQLKGSSDPDVLTDFFPEGFPQNIGLVMGNGIVALDVDRKSGGLDTLKALEAEHGSLPKTPTQVTGNGGLHYLFRISGNVKLGNRTGFLPGLDLKSDNGQVVVEPSLNPEGRSYRWVEGISPTEVEIAETPGWLLNILLQPETKSNIKGGVKEGGRNVALTREAGRLRARGAEEDEIRSALIARNSSFLPPLDLREVNRVAASAMTWPIGALRYTPNDHGLATRFVDELGEDLRFIADENTWLIWDGNIWERDETGRVVQLFLEMARAMLDEAEAIPASVTGDDRADAKNNKPREKAIVWAKQGGEHKRVISALRVAQTDPRVVVTMLQLDNFPGLLPVANGIVELKSGKLLPNAKEKLATKASPIAYKPGAQCPRWRSMIADALPGELGPFVQRSLGYSLLGTPREQRFFLWYGKGADSKSVTARVVTHLLGPLVTQPAAETFLATDNERDGNAPRSDLMALRGVRLIIAGEPSSRRKLDEALLKRLTGGDKVNARAVYGRTKVEFDMTGSIFLPTNHLPGADESDPAFWRRALLVPFDRSLPEEEWDLTLFDTLIADEAEGILNWLIEGALAYANDGLRVPEIVRQRTRAWRREVGSIERFVDERCIREGSVPLRDLHDRYQGRCRSEWVHPLGLGKLSARLKQLGFTIEVAQAGETVIGLRSLY